jgi:hypothetical protein
VIGGRPAGGGLLWNPRVTDADWKNEGMSVGGGEEAGDDGPLRRSPGNEGSGMTSRESSHVGGLLSWSPREIVHEPVFGALTGGGLGNAQAPAFGGLWPAMAKVSFHIRPKPTG